MIVSPTLGVGSLTDFVSERSACRGVTRMLAVLLVGSGSYWSAWVIVAVLVVTFGPATRAAICRVWGAPGATVPTFQRPVRGL